MRSLFMKHLLSFLVVLFVIAIGCQKKDASEKSLKVQESDINSLKTFLHNGKVRITWNEYQMIYNSLGTANRILSDESTILVGFDEGGDYLFDNDTLLTAWAQSLDTQEGAALLDKLDEIDSLQTYAISRGIIDDSLETLNYADSLNGCDCSDSTAMANKGFFPFTALYEHTNYGGNIYWSAINIVPSFGWFNGRASSLQDWHLVPRLNLLASRTWWRGQKMVYWSWIKIPNLGSYNFNDKAKSRL